MKMVPAELSMRTPSAAEQKVFKLLRHVELDGGWALHSVNLSEHHYKMCGEIDFLLVGPFGILVLEVKGGRVACRDGVWTFTDRNEKVSRRAEGPFAQAQSATFSLLDRLGNLLPAGAVPPFVFGWAVVFPDQEFDAHSVEWAQESVIGERDCFTAQNLEAALRRVVRYWTGKARGGKKARLDADACEALLAALRPSFELLPSLRSRSEYLDVIHDALTHAQYKVLDALSDNDRILCAGGAGTGKTFLAAEVARREASVGRSVLLTCKSEILARFLASQPGLDSEDCDVRQLSGVPRGSRYSCVVIDEAQDLMNIDDLATVDTVVEGGVHSGRWRMFYDLNNQTGLIGNFDASAHALLLEAAPVRLNLPDNCRSTRDIVTQVQLVTGADVGVSTAGAGVSVGYAFWTTEEEEAELLTAHLDALLEDGVEPRHITLLSQLAMEESAVRLLPSRLRTRVRGLDGHSVLHPVSGLGYARIRDFKGLENRFICVLDVTDLGGADDRLNQLYVGMTRARAGLWLALHERTRAQLDAGRRLRARIEKGTR